MKPVHFLSASAFRRWLEENHATAPELWVGFYKQSSGKAGLTYKEAVDEALCFGWIDGIVRSLGHESYMHRFTPRRPNSIWSNANVGHIERLAAAGKMHADGLAAFARRKPEKTGIYAFEAKTPAKLPAAFRREFQSHQKAWQFFASQPPGYQRLAISKIISPKQEATRRRWLERLIRASAAGQRLESISSRPK